MYSSFWLHMTIHNKINISGFVALHLDICVKLETILAINGKTSWYKRT